jgi:hypothetical protein
VVLTSLLRPSEAYRTRSAEFRVTPQAERAWAELLDKTFSGLIGTTYDKESYQMARKYLDEYLAAHSRP